MAIEKVCETVIVGPTSGPARTSVCSHVQYQGFRRHKTEVTFRPQLCPVKYSDTVYAYINSTRKRYVSKTFYQARVKPKSFAETTYAGPKTKEEVFVTYLDQNPDADRKWFKTAVEIKPRRFRAAQTLPSPTDINSNSLSVVNQALIGQQRLDYDVTPNDATMLGNANARTDRNQNGGLADGQPFREIYDPGASQVFIPERKMYTQLDDAQSVLGQQLILDFPNDSSVELLPNGTLHDCSNV